MTMAGERRSERGRNRRVALAASAVVAAMVGLSFASVPLYKLFCQATGFGGTVQVAGALPGQVAERRVTVRFDTNVERSLPWNFGPEQASVTVRVGEPALVFFRAVNTSAIATAGTASFNVAPDKAGVIFNKTQCFCFERQEIAAGESAEFPVSFFLDPAMLSDPGLADVDTITLSYTFFRASPPATAALPVAAPRVN